jgi:5,10-methylenetetrahydromethanopterin reductase
MRLSLLIPTVPATAEEAVPFARYVGQSSQLSRLWQGQAYGLDPNATFSYLAGAGYRVPVGLCVLVIPMRHPSQAALEARTLAVVTGYSPIVGFGPGSIQVQRSKLGAPYRSQIGACAEFLLATRASLGQFEVADGLLESRKEVPEYFHVDTALPYVPSPPVRLGLGVLRAQMAELAGSVADAAITWLTPAAYLREVVVPAVRQGADKAERAVPDVVALVPVAVIRDGRDAVSLAHISAGGHLTSPHYVDMLGRAGINVASSDSLEAARRLVVGGGFLHGSGEQIAEGLAAYQAAGVDEVVLNMTSSYKCYGLAETLADIDAILAASARGDSEIAPLL